MFEVKNHFFVGLSKKLSKIHHLQEKLVIRTVRRKSTSLIPNFALPSRNSDFLGHAFPENPAFLKMTPDSPLRPSRTRCRLSKGRAIQGSPKQITWWLSRVRLRGFVFFDFLGGCEQSRENGNLDSGVRFSESVTSRLIKNGSDLGLFTNRLL